jgi:hypothetical protein
MNRVVQNQRRLFTLVNQFSFATPPARVHDFAVRAGVKRKPGIACQMNESRAGTAMIWTINRQVERKS